MTFLGPCNDCITCLIAPRCRSLSHNFNYQSAFAPSSDSDYRPRSASDNTAGPMPLPFPSCSASLHTGAVLFIEPWLLWANLARLYKGIVALGRYSLLHHLYTTNHTPPYLQSIAHIYHPYPGCLTTFCSPTHPRCQPINLKQGPPGQPNRRHRAIQRISFHGHPWSARRINTPNTACRSSVANTQLSTHDALRSSDRHSATRQQV